MSGESVNNDAGTEDWYYYITDHAGSVVGVIDESGDLVNHYVYDAFGNLLPHHSFETVPNRYQFHGREYDEHRGDYYYRHRTYIPAWGSFTGPDPVIDPYNPRGAANYLFCRNNPLVYSDPRGLYPWGAFFDSLGKQAKEKAQQALQGGAIAGKAVAGNQLNMLTGGTYGGGLTRDFRQAAGVIGKGAKRRYGEAYEQSDSYLGTAAFIAGDITGANTLAEGIYGVDILSGEELGGTERLSRTLTGTGGMMLIGAGGVRRRGLYRARTAKRRRACCQRSCPHG